MLRRLAAASLAAFAVVATPAPADAWTLTWLGHAGFVIEAKDGSRVVCDPWLENPKFPKGYQLPERLDGVLVSHGHFDHAGSAAAISAKHKAPIVGCYELTSVLAPKDGPQAMGGNVGGSFQVKGITVHLVPAMHSSSHAGEGQAPTYTGAPVGFVLMAKGERPLYFAGDTGLMQDHKTIGEAYKPGIALLPIGGMFTLDPALAAKAAAWMGVKDVVPMHFGTFPPLTGRPAALKAAAPGLKVHEATPGKAMTLN